MTHNLNKVFNKPTNKELSLFVRAAGFGDNAVINSFLDKYPQAIDIPANSIHSFSPQSALRIAAGSGQADTIQLLVKRGANVNAADSFGMTALDYAEQSGEAKAADALLSNGANINNKHGQQLLERAISNLHVGIVRSMLKHGVSFSDGSGKRALGIIRERIQTMGDDFAKNNSDLAQKFLQDARDIQTLLLQKINAPGIVPPRKNTP